MKLERTLRDYQSESLHAARVEVSKGFTRVLIQLATGTGKTRMVASAINNAISKKNKAGNYQNVWFIIPRNEILWQASGELSAWGIKHGTISATSSESPAFQVHLCSRETLRRRIKQKRIRNWPDVIIFDEAHLALDQQIFIRDNSPATTLFLGVTATPELLSGRGLTDMWETWVPGPQFIWFVEYKFLKRPLVYGVPKSDRVQFNEEFTINGDLTKRAASDLNEKIKTRAKNGFIYGDVIEHYWSYSNGRSFIDFCRSIEEAENVAEEFRKKGFKVESIDGKMSDKTRRAKIDAVKSGELIGLTSVDLITYGLDVPKISCIIMQRPTMSLALQYQMIGRGARPDDDYDNFTIHDHVGNCDDDKHGHPLQERTWNFSGTIKREKKPKNAVERLEAVSKCPICWDLIIDGVCRSCGHVKEKDGRTALKQVDGWLVEIKEPTPLKERPPENRREYTDMINNNIDRFRRAWYPNGEHKGGIIDDEAVKNLVEAYRDICKKPEEIHKSAKLPNDKTINTSLLFSIQRHAGYKNGWAHFRRKELEKYYVRYGYIDETKRT